MNSDMGESLFNEPIDPKIPIEVPALRGKWKFDSKGKVDCFTCVCLNCANNGKSCSDCKGIEACMKQSSKVDHCPDYRKEVT